MTTSHIKQHPRLPRQSEHLLMTLEYSRYLLTEKPYEKPVQALRIWLQSPARKPQIPVYCMPVGGCPLRGYFMLSSASHPSSTHLFSLSNPPSTLFPASSPCTCFSIMFSAVCYTFRKGSASRYCSSLQVTILSPRSHSPCPIRPEHFQVDRRYEPLWKVYASRLEAYQKARFCALYTQNRAFLLTR